MNIFALSCSVYFAALNNVACLSHGHADEKVAQISSKGTAGSDCTIRSQVKSCSGTVSI